MKRITSKRVGGKMALTVVPSARVFNGNVGTQAYVSGSTGSKCLCCPYGYHIDLDFVRYCEAVAAGSAGDRSSIERRKKRERRRQCQSMEVLLGLVSPALVGIEAELAKIPQEAGTANGATSSSLTSHDRRGYTQESPVLDLSDVVGDFEATLKRSTRPSKTYNDKQERTESDLSILKERPINFGKHRFLFTQYLNTVLAFYWCNRRRL